MLTKQDFFFLKITRAPMIVSSSCLLGPLISKPGQGLSYRRRSQPDLFLFHFFHLYHFFAKCNKTCFAKPSPLDLSVLKVVGII